MLFKIQMVDIIAFSNPTNKSLISLQGQWEQDGLQRVGKGWNQEVKVHICKLLGWIFELSSCDE